MSRFPANLCKPLGGVLLVLAAGGCQMQPWQVGDLARRHAPISATTIDRADRDLGLQIAMASHAADRQALTDVMREVQQLGETNPAAQQKLLSVLDQSKPELWPLVVQQFRSSLACHDKLVAAENKPTPLVAASRPAPEEGSSQHWPSEPAAGIQASYVPPPDEANPRPPVEQAVLSAPTPAEIGATTDPPHPPAAPPVKLPQVDVEESRDADLLQLPRLTFCKNVYGYGAYDPCDPARFSPAEQVLLYVEVEHYHSESTPDGFVTRLAATYQILDERGQRVAGGDFPEVEDTCRSRRRDFHIQYGLVLPDTMAPGKYRLRLAMRDLQGDRVGQETIGFEIGGREP